jgi:hypothetical protein
MVKVGPTVDDGLGKASQTDVRVTLLAATISTDCVLVGSDGPALVSEDPGVANFPRLAFLRAEKFQQVRDLPLMWGFAGSSSPKRDFAAWVAAELVPDSWDQLHVDVAGKVGDINAAMRGRAKRAGTELPSSAFFATCGESPGGCERL